MPMRESKEIEDYLIEITDFKFDYMFGLAQSKYDTGPYVDYCQPKINGNLLHPKIDGVSIALLYENGVLVRGATRGDGVKGDDVTMNLKTVHSIPLRLRGKVLHNAEIRGEVYMPVDGFKKMNKGFSFAPMK